MVRFIAIKIFQRDLQLSRRMKRHPSNSRTLRSERLQKRLQTRVSGLVRVLPRVWGLYRRIGRGEVLLGVRKKLKETDSNLSSPIKDIRV